MKIAVIDSGILSSATACRSTVKGHDVLVFKKQTSIIGIPLCLASSKIIATNKTLV